MGFCYTYLKMIKRVFAVSSLCLLLLTAVFSASTFAQQGGFSVQVTPSPIVESLQPGVQKTVELKIRNTSTQNEELKMGLRSFTFDSASGEVKLQDEPQKEVVDWVSFENPVFRVNAGEWFTQRITFSPPKTAGFSYSFAITVGRSQPQTQTGGKAAIEGSVAVFTLLNVERPDATRKLEIVTVSSQKKLYEYLPATFTVRLKNSGNTIVKPAGNVYIQRSDTSTDPLSVLPLNEAGSYILPGSEREVSMQWKDGFPVYESVDGKQNLVWDWGNVQKFRIGKFSAKTIMVYNDGQRDIPVEAVVTFWVFPWKMVLVLVIIGGIIIVGIVTIIKKIVQKAHKPKKAHETPAQ